jgi:hypothetical protein
MSSELGLNHRSNQNNGEELVEMGILMVWLGVSAFWVNPYGSARGKHATDGLAQELAPFTLALVRC